MQINFVFNWLPILCTLCVWRSFSSLRIFSFSVCMIWFSFQSIFVSFRFVSSSAVSLYSANTMKPAPLLRHNATVYRQRDRQRLWRIVYRLAPSKFVIPYCHHSFLFCVSRFLIAIIEKVRFSSATQRNERAEKIPHTHTHSKNPPETNARSNGINQFHFYLNVMTFLWIEIS